MLFEKLREWGFNLSDRQFQIIQLIFTIGLMITIIVATIAIFKYAELLKTDPCDLCTQPLIKNISYLLK